MRSLVLIGVFLSLAVSAAAGELVVGHFSAGDLTGWQVKKFKGQTRYDIVEIDGRRALKAESNAAASGFFKEIEADTKAYPVLSWSWRVENLIQKADARSKAGDDYAARIYVVFPGKLFWQTTGLTYIWANKLPVGRSVPNAYAPDNVFMIAVESGPSRLKKWVSEKRNLREDYKRLFGKDPPGVGAIAVMTDTDNTGESAVAYYGDIHLSGP